MAWGTGWGVVKAAMGKWPWSNRPLQSHCEEVLEIPLSMWRGNPDGLNSSTAEYTEELIPG